MPFCQEHLDSTASIDKDASLLHASVWFSPVQICSMQGALPCVVVDLVPLFLVEDRRCQKPEIRVLYIQYIQYSHRSKWHMRNPPFFARSCTLQSLRRSMIVHCPFEMSLIFDSCATVRRRRAEFGARGLEHTVLSVLS